MNTPLTRIQEERLKSAVSCLERGQPADAIEILVTLSLEASQNAEVFYQLGTAYHSQGYLDRAISSLEHCLRLYPHHTNASIALSVILNDVGQYDRAAEIFTYAEKSLTASPTDLPKPPSNDVNAFFSEKHQELAGLYLTHHRFEEAIREAENAITLTPREPKARVLLSRALAKKGMLQRAIEELQRIKREFPQYLPARINLGIVHYTQGNVPLALGEWEKVLTLDPQNEEARKLYSMINTSAKLS